MARRVLIPIELDEAVVDGRSSPKLRRSHRGDISDEKIGIFLETLAETCNVVRAAKAAGVSKSWMYRKRRYDAAFRNAWAAAVREGYAMLELILLERAMKGTPKLVRTAKGTDRVMREYSTALAVALLRRHAETADSAEYQPGEEEMSELRERILEKLEGLRRREEEAKVETKGVDPIELIRWALAKTKGPLRRSSSGPPPRSGEEQ